jgi:hypothetical protein
MTATNDRSILSSEKTPHIDETETDSNKESGLGPQQGLDTKIDW